MFAARTVIAVNVHDIKIALVAPHAVSYHVGFYRELERQGFGSTVLYCDRLYDREVYDAEFMSVIVGNRELVEGYRHEFLKNQGLRKHPGFLARVNWSLIRKVRKYDVIVINGFGIFSYWLAFAAAKLSGRKVIVKGEGTVELYDGMPRWRRSVRKMLLTFALRLSDAVLYSCRGNEEYWEYHKVSRDKLFSCPCAVDNDFFRSQYHGYRPARQRIRKELGISENEFVPAFVSRFTARKRPMDLLMALDKLRNAGHETITALFVGDGPERENMRQFCDRSGVRAVFAGYQTQRDIGRYYSAADAYIMISECDPSPKALNEAMNFALPVVVTHAVGTASDLVKEGLNGYIVGVGDVDALASRIETMSTDRARTDEMGRESLKIVQDFNYEECVRNFESALGFVFGRQTGFDRAKT